MDLDFFRSALTLLGLLCFIGIAVWAYSKSAKRGFDEAANAPFTEDDAPAQDDAGRDNRG
ncbi:MAG: CcoQ/FixQ family Cbb3-type cytochrome c oxidase assembly chaperone [Rhodocyclaceae bacterium]